MKRKIDNLLKESNFVDAERLIASEIRKQSVIVDLLHLYTKIFQLQKKWSSVVEVLKVLIFLGEKTAGNYASLIQSYRNSGDIDAADCVATEAIAYFPKDISVQSEYSWNAQVRGNWVEAVKRLELLSELSGLPESGRIFQRLSDARFKLSLLEESKRDIIDGLSEEFDLVLTTFPEHKSRNVGDDLICSSTVKMIRSRDISFNPKFLFREAALDEYPDGLIRKIVAPGFSVSEGVYPNLFKLYRKIDRLPSFFPVGCSFQSSNPSLKAFEENIYSQKTLDFLKFVVDRSGPLPCRDQMIVNMLHANGIGAVYSGDMAIYDEKYINKKFESVSHIKSVVFTIQHSARYNEQSIVLINLIKRRFNGAKLYVAFHSKPNDNSQRIANHAAENDFHVLHLYGNSENLDVYNEIDLHIGYRLHGHISFLRRRKPSILMTEDVRSLGFSKTLGTGLGCFEALSVKCHTADDKAPVKAMDFIDEQLRVNFLDYQSVFSFVDKTYRDFVSPFFDRLAK